MKITINELQVYLADRYGGWATEQSMFMKLVEEIGEVAEVLNKRAGRKASDETDLSEQLGTELADMIHYIVAIAAINDIDLERIIMEKDRKASIRYNHRVNLPFILSIRYFNIVENKSDSSASFFNFVFIYIVLVINTV